MLKINIKTNSSAYRDENENLDTSELVWNLEEIINKLEEGLTYGIIMDINGNKVGEWEVD